ncbi:MAG: cytochrome B [Gammaproteobacteria bacterium]|nr:MAG: cytochrome B [Gammaproteobacteria bacterium]
MKPDPDSRPPLIWDLPLRLFHWALAIAVGVCIYTGLDGGFYEMDWHMISGYAVLGLLLFRISWGIVGPRHARFAAFIQGPVTVWHWLRAAVRRDPPPVAGHNPLAGWFILITLTALLVQAITGLFATDDIFVEGPLRHIPPPDFLGWTQTEFLRFMTRIHRQGEYIVIGLVALHLFAILAHRVYLREPLTSAMITGRKRGAPVAEALPGQRILLGIGLGAAAAGLTYYIINL